MTNLDFVLLFAAGQLKEGKDTTIYGDASSIRPPHIDIDQLRPNGQLRYPSTVSTAIMKGVFLLKGIYYYPQSFHEPFSAEGFWSSSKDRIKTCTFCGSGSPKLVCPKFLFEHSMFVPYFCNFTAGFYRR